MCPTDVKNVSLVCAKKQHRKQWAEKKDVDEHKEGWWQAPVKTFLHIDLHRDFDWRKQKYGEALRGGWCYDTDKLVQFQLGKH